MSVVGDETPRPRKPVKWLDVRQLVQTAIDVLQASSFARFADRRESMAAAPREFYTLPDATGAVWVDYVADTGDGFDATFATARCLTGGAIINPPDAFADRPTRADLLVLGGDLVYPVASARSYEERFTAVLRRAAELDEPAHRPILAMPGNHDWYDGLGAFRRIFCESYLEREVAAGDTPAGLVEASWTPNNDLAGWGTVQSRSYFAIRLRPGWWLWAVDGQLDRPIDAEQLSYFRAARNLLAGDDAIVLCPATPSWLEAGGDEHYHAPVDSPLFTTLWFLDRTLGAERARVRLVITGDQHHYTRYTAQARSDFSPDLLTCGGGGAFLSSTHHLPPRLRFDLTPWNRHRSTCVASDVTFTLDDRCYPDKPTSRRLGWTRLPRAAVGNGWTLPVLLGLLMLPLYMTLSRDGMETVRTRPFWLALLAVVGVTALYSKSGVKDHRGLLGRGVRRSLLTAGHSAGYLGVATTVAGLTEHVAPWLYPSSEWEHPLAWLTEVAVRGTLAVVVLGTLGTVVFTLYLWLADRVLRCHTLEAYSGLQIQDYKCHLRLRVEPDRVEVVVLGIDRVPRARRGGTARLLVRLANTRPVAALLARGAPGSARHRLREALDGRFPHYRPLAPEAKVIDRFVVERCPAQPGPSDPVTASPPG